nr:hypothetical protein [Tanacetum cinerariifolium]GFA08809.1 hypothetical protein [Tanacetum cinerariifolium]
SFDCSVGVVVSVTTESITSGVSGGIDG